MTSKGIKELSEGLISNVEAGYYDIKMPVQFTLFVPYEKEKYGKEIKKEITKRTMVLKAMGFNDVDLILEKHIGKEFGSSLKQEVSDIADTLPKDFMDKVSFSQDVFKFGKENSYKIKFKQN